MIFKVALPERIQFRIIQKERSGEIHYIGGTEVLPPPLEAEQEKEMIQKLDSPMRIRRKVH